LAQAGSGAGIGLSGALVPGRSWAEAMSEITLTVWFHPTMAIPFKFDVTANPFKMRTSAAIVDLMDACELVFERESQQVAGSKAMELQINVLWNIKDHSKALNPNDKIGDHFKDGDTFGVYGDLQPLDDAPVHKTEDQKVPVTILTGFLGSGKTTLLNYILQEQTDKKIAVIENEFGEISIDDALLKQDKLTMAEKVLVMDNGCMCCTIRGDLIEGLKGIADDLKKGSGYDQIIIETTGMADPVPIVRTFMSEEEIQKDLRLDGVVAMADAKHLPGRLDDKIEAGKVNEAYQQIAFADKIILNKLDLITTDEAIACKDRIREINKYAKVLPAVRGRVKVAELTNMRAHDMTNFVNENIELEAEVPAELAEPTGHGGHGGDHGHPEDCQEEHGGGHGGGHEEGHGSDHGGGHAGGHGGGHGHGKVKGENRHDNRVNSFAIVKEGEIVPRRLSAWMQSLGSLPPDKGVVYRIKAILAVKGHPFKHVFHAVMDISDEDDAGPWAEGEKKISKIVFIGKSLDEAFLRAGFLAIFE